MKPPSKFATNAMNHRQRPLKQKTGCKQSGMVLVISLIFLLVLSLLGITALGTSKLELNMGIAAQEQTKILQIAESALQNVSYQYPTGYSGGPPVVVSAGDCKTTVAVISPMGATITLVQGNDCAGTDTYWYQLQN